MNRAAPQMPLGRRPVCIQSRFMEATMRRAVLATAWREAGSSSASSRSAKRCRYRDGSTGLPNSPRSSQHGKRNL